MTFRVRLTAEAQANQNEIADWIAERSIDGALKWLDAFQRTTQQLALRPDAFSPAPENEFCDRLLCSRAEKRFIRDLKRASLPGCLLCGR